MFIIEEGVSYLNHVNTTLSSEERKMLSLESAFGLASAANKYDDNVSEVVSSSPLHIWR